ncbi:MAG: hypothetical protein K8I00_12590, partial [Candidatus Omnitrophica bacterium]|nr:hypothetical protein [Candidatus Omnitrophota bacterium]
MNTRRKVTVVTGITLTIAILYALYPIHPVRLFIGQKNYVLKKIKKAGGLERVNAEVIELLTKYSGEDGFHVLYAEERSNYPSLSALGNVIRVHCHESYVPFILVRYGQKQFKETLYIIDPRVFGKDNIQVKLPRTDIEQVLNNVYTYN